jgi:N utilization substance protein B
MTRREAREAVFALLFEAEFRKDETAEQIYAAAVEHRDLPKDSYIHDVFFGIDANRATLDAMIEKHARGWTIGRMSHVSRSVLRISAYEMMFMREAVPFRVSINEAIELTKKFDGDKARGFINGILNAIKNDLTNDQPKASDAPIATGDEDSAEQQ